MVPDFLRQYKDSHRERPSRERQKIHKVNLLEIWNSKQESTIPNLNRSSENRGRPNQKRVEKSLNFGLHRNKWTNYIKNNLEATLERDKISISDFNGME